MTSWLAPVLGAAWGAFVLATAARLRPAPARLRALAGETTRPGSRRRRVELGDVAGTVGRLVARTGDVDRQRRLGGAVIAAAVAAALVPSSPVVPAAAAGGLAWWWPAHRRRRRANRGSAVEGLM